MSTSGESKPPTTLDTARDLVARLYPQIQDEVKEVKEIVSYDDRNYILKDGQGRPVYILKVTNSVDSEPEGMLEAQNEMMLHININYPDLKVPLPLFNVHGKHIAREAFSSDDNKLFAVRLLKFVPGTRLYEFKMTSQRLLQSGDLLGRLHAAINDGQFASRAILDRNYLWSLKSVPELRSYLHVFDSEAEKATLVRSVLDDFDAEVVTQMKKLPKAYIYGDFNEQNILVDENSGNVDAIIDFGDICFVPRVFDIAIAITYLMLLEAEGEDLDLVLSGPRYVLQGFLKHVQLSQEELSLLLTCSRARLAQSLTLGAYTYLQQPGNEYLLTTQAKGWAILKRLHEHKEKKEALLSKWMQPID